MLAIAFTVAPRPADADNDADRRALAGARIFRSLLAADLDLERKVAADGALVVLVHHSGDAARAEELATALGGDPAGGPDPIRSLPVRLAIERDPEPVALTASAPAAIFLAEAPTPETLRALIRFGIERHVIVYSPFEGHVEDGVLAGLSVEAQVRPYVNLETLAASGISLKAFFMKVAKVYPQ